MGRAPCCAKVGLHRGPWTPREDKLLSHYIQAHGEGHWRSLPKKAGLLRCGKSCRLRWMNYLRPDIKRGNITPDEDDLIIRLHSLLGNRWSLIAGRLPGRTDNEIKNYWNTHLGKREAQRAHPDPNNKKLSKKTTTNTTTSRKKSSKNNDEDDSVVIAKQIVHLPKPSRVRRNYSFEAIYNTKCGSSSSPEKGVSTDHCSSDVYNNDQDDIPWSLFSTKDQDSNSGGVLEKIYEEYLAQLLKTDNQGDDHDQLELDSFAESLLV